MEVKEINNKEIWENFLSECKEKTFLNSWNWGEFQRKEGNKIWRLGAYDNEQIVGGTLIIKVEARRGTFLFVPHGPSAREQGRGNRKQILEVLLEELKKIVKEEGASFIRVASIWERNEENVRIFREIGFKEAPIHMHPEVTWEMDIKPSEENLLMDMRKTTRYLIRQGLKDQDLTIIQSKKIEDVEVFNRLYQATVNRHHFVPFSLDCLKNEFETFLPDNQILTFLARYKDEVIASAIMVFWQKIGFYHHGASSLKYPKVPASYLLQWEAIKEAKKRGCEFYNFWGIADKSEESKDFKKHPWAGLTLFKKGFGGYKKEYVKTQDLILSQKYWLNYIIEKLRKIKRRV